VLVASRVQVAGDVDDLLATHSQLIGPRSREADLPRDWQVISASHTDRQSTLLVRTNAPIDDPSWVVDKIGLEDLVLAYLSQATRPSVPNTHSVLEARR
jgi:ABC-2 type transport system ATP-binding protein